MYGLLLLKNLATLQSCLNLTTPRLCARWGSWLDSGQCEGMAHSALLTGEKKWLATTCVSEEAHGCFWFWTAEYRKGTYHWVYWVKPKMKCYHAHFLRTAVRVYRFQKSSYAVTVFNHQVKPMREYFKQTQTILQCDCPVLVKVQETFFFFYK